MAGDSVEITVDASITDEFGKFMSRIDAGLDLAFEEIAREGEALSFSLAPTGKKKDHRTVSIREGMYHDSDATHAEWGSTARHTLYQEEGGGPHLQTGWAHFYWEKMGREWIPGPNEIKHPGNPEHRFLLPALEEMMLRTPDILRHYLPGGATLHLR